MLVNSACFLESINNNTFSAVTVFPMTLREILAKCPLTQNVSNVPSLPLNYNLITMRMSLNYNEKINIIAYFFTLAFLPVLRTYIYDRVT